MNGVSNLTVTEQVSLVFFESLPANGESLSLLFHALSHEGVNIDMISQSAPRAHSVSLSFTISDDDLVKTLRICNDLSRENEGLKPMVSSCNCKIQLYGAEMATTPGVAAKALSALYTSGVEVQLITTSEVDISCLLSRIDVDGALDALRLAFAL